MAVVWLTGGMPSLIRVLSGVRVRVMTWMTVRGVDDHRGAGLPGRETGDPPQGASTSESEWAKTNGVKDCDDFEMISRRSVISFRPWFAIAWRNQAGTLDDSGQHDAPAPTGPGA